MPKNIHIKEHQMSRSIFTRASCWWHQMCLLVAGALAVLVMLTGCGTGSSPRGELAENQRILASCDSSAPPGSLVEIDGTGSSASEEIVAERMAVVESVARRTAVCSGHLRVVVFSASSAATTTLFDGPLRMHGATENARLKHVPDAVADVIQKVWQGVRPGRSILAWRWQRHYGPVSPGR